MIYRYRINLGIKFTDFKKIGIWRVWLKGSDRGCWNNQSASVFLTLFTRSIKRNLFWESKIYKACGRFRAWIDCSKCWEPLQRLLTWLRNIQAQQTLMHLLLCDTCFLVPTRLCFFYSFCLIYLKSIHQKHWNKIFYTFFHRFATIEVYIRGVLVTCN